MNAESQFIVNWYAWYNLEDCLQKWWVISVINAFTIGFFLAKLTVAVLLLLIIIERTASFSWVDPTKFIIHFLDRVISEVLFPGYCFFFNSKRVVLHTNLRNADWRMIAVCLLLTSSEWCNTIIDLTIIAIATTRFNWLQFHLLNFSFAFRFGAS